VLLVSVASAAIGATASATINDAMGKTIGTATLRETNSGVLIQSRFRRGAGGHARAGTCTRTGKCDRPMFMTWADTSHPP